MGEDNPVYFDREQAQAAGFRDVAAPPMFAVVYSWGAVGPARPRPRGRDQLRDDGPRRPGVRLGRAGLRGDTITTEISVKDIYERGGMGFYVFESVSRNQDGQEVVRGTWTNIVRGSDDGQVELKVTPDKYLPHRYAGASGDFNPIHIDPEFAKQVGLPSNILHGLYSMAQVARACTRPPAATRARCAGCPSSSAGWACPSRRSSSPGGEEEREAPRRLARGRPGRQQDHPERRGRARDRLD